MEENLDPHKFKEIGQIVGEDIIDLEQDTDEVSELVETTKENLKNVVSEKTMDEWTRLYLRTYYRDTENYHVNASDIHARFEVLDQSEEHFEVSYIMLKDTVNYWVGGTGHLSYVKENNHWVFLEYEHVEEVEVDGVNYLIYKVFDSYSARNIIDSDFNDELANAYYE